MVTIEQMSESPQDERSSGLTTEAARADSSSGSCELVADATESSLREQAMRSIDEIHAAGQENLRTGSSDSTGTSNDGHDHFTHEGDDWETASEGDEEDASASTSSNSKEKYEDALTEEEQRQKTITQANASKAEGNALYAAGKYGEALENYASALEIAPEHSSTIEIRAMCYCNRAACYLQLKQYEEAVADSTKALELNPNYMKALLRRAQGQEKLDHLDEALADMKKVLELDPGSKQARESITRLEPLVAEKREKMKEEMIGKLKDLGNSILGNFGMSIDNFKAVKDPDTGSYSISFQK